MKILILVLLIQPNLSFAFYKNLNTSLTTFHDASGAMQIQDLKNIELFKSVRGGFFEGQVWHKVNICNHDNKSLFLVYQDITDKMEVYNGERSLIWRYDFSSITSNNFDFWIKSPLNISGCEDFILKFEYADVLNSNIYLIDAPMLKVIERNHQLFYSFFFALVIIIFCITLYFLIRFKTVIYFYFIGILFFQDIIGVSLLTGYIFLFIEPLIFLKYDIANVAALIMNTFLILFSIKFISPKSVLDMRISKFLLFSQIILALFGTVSAMLNFRHQSALFSQITNNSIIIVCCLILYLAARNIRSHKAQFFLLGSGAKAFGLFIKTLALQGDLYFIQKNSIYFLDFVIYNSVAIGSSIEAITILILLVEYNIKEIEEKNLSLFKSQTALKELEYEFRKMDDLYKIARQVAHDIRSPLSALNIASKKVKESSNDLGDLIASASNRINSIAESLVAKFLHANNNNLEKSADIVSIINMIIREKKTKEQEKEINITFSVNAPEIFVVGNPHEFARAISNIMENAIEAIPSGGKIELSANKINGNLVELKIKDNGKGISSEIIGKIGQYGFSYGKPNGTGIGLAHAIKIIKECGGDIHIESKENSGTCISIKLNPV